MHCRKRQRVIKDNGSVVNGEDSSGTEGDSDDNGSSVSGHPDCPRKVPSSGGC